MKSMSIRPETLETPERGLTLENRTEKVSAKTRAKAADLREENESLREELDDIKKRTNEARELPLPKSGFLCFDCYRKGLADAADHAEGKRPRRENPDRDRP